MTAVTSPDHMQRVTHYRIAVQEEAAVGCTVNVVITVIIMVLIMMTRLTLPMTDLFVADGNAMCLLS